MKINQKKTLVMLLSSIAVVACNNTGGSTQQSNSNQVNSTNSNNGESTESRFTASNELDAGAVQNYGIKGLESKDNSPGWRISSGIAHVSSEKDGEFTLIYGGCVDDTQKQCYNDLWIYNHTTKNWVWVAGDKGAQDTSNSKYAFATSAIQVKTFIYPEKSIGNEYLNRNIEVVAYPEMSNELKLTDPYHGPSSGNYYNYCKQYNFSDYRYKVESEIKEFCDAIPELTYFNNPTQKRINIEKISGTPHEITAYITIPQSDQSKLSIQETRYEADEMKIDPKTGKGTPYSKTPFSGLIQFDRIGLPETEDIFKTEDGKYPGSGILTNLSRRLLSVKDGLPTFILDTNHNNGRYNASMNYIVGGYPTNQGGDLSGIGRVIPDLSLNLVSGNKLLEPMIIRGEGFDPKVYDAGEEYKNVDPSILYNALKNFTIPVQRSNTAATISSDKHYLYFYSGLGVISATNADNYKDYYYLTPLGDFWRLNLETGKYERIDSIQDPTKPLQVLPAGRIGATLWESSGQIYLFGGSAYKQSYYYDYQNYAYGGGLEYSNILSRCYYNDLWVYNSSAAPKAWKLVSGKPNECSTEGLGNKIDTPSSQMNTVVWKNKDGKFELFGGSDRFKGDIYTFNHNPSWLSNLEHWIINNLTPEKPADIKIKTYVAPEGSFNQLWKGNDSLIKIPVGSFGLREINVELSESSLPAWGYSLRFRDSPNASEFSIDVSRSNCRKIGQAEGDTSINSWQKLGEKSFRCSFVAKFQPRSKSSSGSMYVDLVKPDGSVVSTSTQLIHYSAR